MLITSVYSGLNMSGWKSDCEKGSSSQSSVLDQGVRLWVRLLSASAVQREVVLAQ